MGKIQDRLNLARKELLDLSFKNPLLNYKQRVATGLEFPKINASDVFNYVVNENKKLYFSTEETNNPGKLYVSLSDKELHRKVVKTYRTSLMHLEEKGANILFLALGFLKWKETEGDVFYRSPLILVPVELQKAENQDKFFLQYSGEEIRLNISLITKMESDFKININYDYEDEITGIDEYLRKVNDIIQTSSVKDWEVESTKGAFDFFSYAKFLMYRDLDVSLWKRETIEKGDSVLKKLFVTNFDDKLSENVDKEKHLSPQKIYNIVDADSSQAMAIYDINQNKNIVIQGPPGTGKSQTITNILATSVANGKSVLFVSEKKAALDVVKTRLEKVGLGDLVLELHSQKVNKKDVLKSIENTLNLGALKGDADKILKDKYEDVKKEVNTYNKIVNDILGRSQIRLVDIYGNALQIKEKLESENIKISHINFEEDISKWSENEFEKRLLLVKEYIQLQKNIGKFEKHPFYGVELKKIKPYEQVAVKEEISDLDDSLEQFVSLVDSIGAIFDNKTANTIFESGRLIASIDALVKYKDINALRCQDSYFIKNKEDVDRFVKCGKSILSFLPNLVYYKDDSYKEYETIINLYNKYISLPSKEKEEREVVKTHLSMYVKSGKFVRSDIEQFIIFLKDVKYIKDNEETVKYLFKDLYRDVFDADWDKIVELTPKVKEFLTLIENYSILSQSREVIKNSETISKLIDLKDEYIEKKAFLIDKIKDFLSSIKFDFLKRFDFKEWYLDMTFTSLKKLIKAWMNNIDSVSDIARFNELTDKLNEIGLSPLLDSCIPTGKCEFMDDILSLEYYEALIKFAYEKYPYLSSFRQYKFERIIDSFKEMDNRLMVENIKYILSKHHSSMPSINENTPDMAIIRREIQKKKFQIPIRKLFEKTGKTIQKIKPIFMMSPISIASFLPPNEIEFDLVVFDEASQVRPIEAFGALLRAKQIVVAGDSKQLPPTSFFDTVVQKYEDYSDEDYDVANMESILSLLLAKNIPQRTLLWHYRSKNQSLISVSNNEFYNHTLKVFPSVYDKDPNKGLVYRHVPNSYYDRGGARTNVVEAREVIKAVFNHAKKHPEMSIGVVSFSLAQQDELYREFDSQIKKVTDNDLKAYFSESNKEPFFIKNLESVQGDERDVIFISIGYGYDKEKNISMDFGPLNREGGERRLNVLITRAKYKCIVFSNLTSHDINLSKTSAVGVVVLKKFLEYAQNRIIFLSKNKEIETDSFRDHIYNKLIEYGYNADKNIGNSMGLDLAIYDNDLKRFTVGVECDGGEFKMSLSLTDRERIRKNMLKILGWKIYHIWAPDFYRNPKNEFGKLLDFIHEAKNSDTLSIDKNKEITIQRKDGEKIKDTLQETVLYKCYNGPKRRARVLLDKDELQDLIKQIITPEAPLHITVLKKRLLTITETNKLNDVQNNLILEIINENQSYKFVDDFIYLSDQEKFDVRDRNALEKYYKKAEFVCDEEYKEYIKLAITNGEAATKEDLIRALPIILGIQRSKYATDKIDALVEEMIKENKISMEKNTIYIE